MKENFLLEPPREESCWAGWMQDGRRNPGTGLMAYRNLTLTFFADSVSTAENSGRGLTKLPQPGKLKNKKE